MKIKLLCILLACLFVFTAGCGKKNKTQTENKEHTEFTDTTDVAGHHIDKSSESGGWFMKDGVCDYKIVSRAQRDINELSAVDEFIKFFLEATGVELPSVDETQVESLDSGKYLVFGNTTHTEAKGLEVGAGFGNGGFEIKTVGDDIFVYSYKTKGTLNGAYQLLKLMLDFEFYHVDTYAINKNVRSIKLMNYDVSEIPDIEYNDPDFKWLTDDVVSMRRYRLMDEDIVVEGAIGHNAFSYVNPDIYLNKEEHPEDYHPKWFMSDKDPEQLCFTAHGDSEELEKMVTVAAEFLKQRLREDLYGTEARFGNIDNGKCCGCAACVAEKKKYGTDAAAHIKFVNRLMTKITDWFESEEGKPYARDFHILMYAYLAYDDAPVKKVNDKWEAVDDSVKTVDGVWVRLAYLGANFTVPLYDEKNATYYENIMQWRAISEKLSFYWYLTNYHYVLAPYNSFDSLQRNYKFAKDLGVSTIYLHTQLTQTGTSTGFRVVQVYMFSKLGWDVNADIETLVRNFFDYYFEDASDIMYKLFMEYRTWTVHLQDDFGKNGYNGIYSDPWQAQFWPQSLLEKWMGYCEDALKAIEPVKESNPTRYAQLYDHITNERLWVRYLYLNIYTDYIDENVLQTMRKEFKEDFIRLGMSKYRYTEDPNTIWAEWGV